jgi:hypothetical protein
MRSLAAIVVAGLTLPAGAEGPKKDPKPRDADWTKVIAAGKFEIEFPGKPTEKAAPTGTVYQLPTTNPIAVYQVAAAPLATKVDLTDAKAIKAIFDHAVTSIRNGLGGQVESDKEAKVADQYPARDVQLKGTGLGTLRVRLVLTGSAFIQVMVAGPQEYVDGADAKRFRESLKITAKE